MAESSSHNTSLPKFTPKEEHATLDKPKSPNPFFLVTQVEFTFEEIVFTTNNEVALIYPSHPNQEYFKDTLEDSKVWVPNPICGVRGDIGITTFRNALRAQYLPHLSRKIGGLDQISNKDATILYCLANETLKPNQPEEPPFTTPMKAICNLDVHVDSKALKPSSQTEDVPQGKKPGAKSGLRRKQYSKHTSESKTEASKSKTGQSKKDTQSSSAKDKSPSHPLPPTLVVSEMHKEAQQAASGLTSLGATSEEGAHPQLSSDKRKSTRDGLKTTRDGLKTAHTNSGTNEESRVDDISKKIKLKDLSEFLKDTRSAFFTPDSPQDKPIIVIDESEEEEAGKDDTQATSHNVTEDTSVLPPLSLKLA
ncbi:hypothetical protein Tco_1357415 [Tanacetum coccineum]